MKLKYLLVTLACTLSFQIAAKPSVNDMQQCQALIDFIEQKLSNPPAKYKSDLVDTAKLGLGKYDDYIQSDIVTPGLVEFNGGDKAKAAEMQKQVDAFKSSLTKALNQRYSQPGLFMDQVVALNECTKKAVPSGEALDDLKRSMESLIALVQS